MNNVGTQNTNVARKVCYVTIFCTPAIIGAYYIITISKASFNAGCHHQPPMMSERVPSQNISDFKSQFKTLYVFNKLKGSVNSTKLADFYVGKSGNAASNSLDYSDFPLLQNGCYSHQEDLKTCSCSEVPGQGFFCIELLPSSDNVFFLETSCASNHQWNGPGIHLGQTRPLSEKQACSIYSAAYHNPSRKVILLFTCPIPSWLDLFEEWETLLSLQNFHFGRVDVAEFYANTSLSDFYNWELALSSFPAQHQADIFRLVVLYLYGGTYMDLDVISLKPLDDLGVNFVGHVNFNLVSNALMHFEPGHGFVKACLFNAIVTYQPDDWSLVGPIILSKTLQNLCNASINLDPKSLMKLTSCNVTVLPRNTFFAVMWQKWWSFYEEKFWPEIKELLNESYAVHYWNHMGHHELVVGSNQPIIKLAQQHCTPVYEYSGSVLD